MLFSNRYGAAFAILLSTIPHWVTADFCATIKSASTGVQIDTPLEPQYEAEQLNYWSAECTALRPSCILMPTSTQQVSSIVSLLQTTNDSFAIKSGGHMPNKYFASIENGVLISTRMLNQVTYDATSQTVKVGPGNKWEEVHEKLQGTGVTVIGGRIGNVGVGGYMLGGT
jgi:FAD/FMN-containing dehydrogenase